MHLMYCETCTKYTLKVRPTETTLTLSTGLAGGAQSARTALDAGSGGTGESPTGIH
jgi:hypothetical protein